MRLDRLRQHRRRRQKPLSLEEVKQHLLVALNEGAVWSVRKIVAAREVLCKGIRFEGNITALHVASKRGHLGVVKCLLDFGFHPNESCSQGFTALHYAVISNQIETVKELLLNGADKRIQCNTGRRAEDLANALDHCHVARLISRWINVWDLLQLAPEEPQPKQPLRTGEVDDILGVIAQKRKSFGPTHAGIARTMERLVDLYARAGEVEDAIRVQEEAVELLKLRNNGKKQKEEFQRHLLRLGRLHFAMRGYRRAAHLFASLQKDLAEEVEVTRCADDSVCVLPRPRVSLLWEVVASLAHCQRAQHKLDRAESSLEWLLDLMEEGSACEDHPWLVRALLFLGEVQIGLKKNAAAKTTFKRAVQIADIHLGPNHVDVALCLDHLAYAYFDGKEYEQAEALFRRALEIREICLDVKKDEDAAEMRTAWNNLALTIKRRMNTKRPFRRGQV